MFWSLNKKHIKFYLKLKLIPSIYFVRLGMFLEKKIFHVNFNMSLFVVNTKNRDLVGCFS